MSLTSHIRSQSIIFWHIVSILNLDYCRELIKHHQQICGRVIHRPVPGTDFRLAGMSTIYAVRDFLGGENAWEDTVAGEFYAYPGKSEAPLRWVVMGLMDSQARSGDYMGHPGDVLRLHPDFNPTIEDVGQIAASFPSVFQRAIPADTGLEDIGLTGENMVVNPRFAGSNLVGGADANLILRGTLWDIRTTARTAPLDLNNIVQQVGYYLLDFENQYQLTHFCWYYSRQQSLFTHPIEPLLAENAKLRFQHALAESALNEI